jgi:hypothetical protein
MRIFIRAAGRARVWMRQRQRELWPTGLGGRGRNGWPLGDWAIGRADFGRLSLSGLVWIVCSRLDVGSLHRLVSFSTCSKLTLPWPVSLSPIISSIIKTRHVFTRPALVSPLPSHALFSLAISPGSSTAAVLTRAFIYHHQPFTHLFVSSQLLCTTLSI